jgi:hypothetical protein
VNEAEQLERESREGHEANQLKRDPSWNRAKAHAEAEIIRQLKSIGIKDKELQADLVRSLQLLGVLTAFIERESETGDMARLSLEKPSMVRKLFG